MAKKKAKKGITTSHQRSMEGIKQAQLRLIEDRSRFAEKALNDLKGEKEKLLQDSTQLGEETELRVPPVSYLNSREFREIESTEVIRLLPDEVYVIYEQTRDGIVTPDEFKKEISLDPGISGEDVYNAIRLGIQDWGTTLFPQNK